MKLFNLGALALTLVLTFACCGIAAEVEFSAPVRVFGSPAADTAANMRMPRDAARPKTLVRGLLPQYQATQAFRSEAATAPDLQNSAMRFLLALPDQMLLLEASVTINGQPFEMVREQRIDRLLADLNKPASEAPQPSSELGESETPADKLGPDGSLEERSDEPSEAATAENEPEIPLRPEPSDSLEARLRRYATATGRPPTRDEVRWLLTKWVDGPTLLILDNNFQRFRSTQAPAFQVLDRDMDGSISAKELGDAQQSLLLCDVNQNDVVEYTEIAEVADDPRRQIPKTPIQALIPILDVSSTAKAFRRIAKEYESVERGVRFDTNANGQLDVSEFDALVDVEPDVIVAVAFDASDPGNSRTRITKISDEFGISSVRTLGSSILFPVGQTFVEFSAVQSTALSGSDQISVGVVNDGYPLLPMIDPNEDGRLTIRELRHVVDSLRRCDTNKDGGISADEIPSTVRVSFGLGPQVHRHLADIRTVHPPSSDTSVAPAPEWFINMDGNRDGDISPREFLLGPEQFKRLDVDGDGLISPAESIALTKNKSQATNQDPETKPEEAKAKP